MATTIEPIYLEPIADKIHDYQNTSFVGPENVMNAQLDSKEKIKLEQQDSNTYEVIEKVQPKPSRQQQHISDRVSSSHGNRTKVIIGIIAGVCVCISIGIAIGIAAVALWNSINSQDIDSSIRQMEDRLGELENDNIDFGSMINATENEISNLKDAVQKKTDEINKLKDADKNKTDEINHFKDEDEKNKEAFNYLKDADKNKTDEINNFKDEINNLKGQTTSSQAAAVGSSAFMALMDGGSQYPAVGDDILFEHVLLNLGQHYDDTTSVFTCAESGLYLFSVTLYSSGIRFDTYDRVSGALMVDSVRVAEISSINSDPDHYQIHQSAVTAVVECPQGGTVWVESQQSNSRVYGTDTNPRSIFTGYAITYYVHP